MPYAPTTAALAATADLAEKLATASAPGPYTGMRDGVPLAGGGTHIIDRQPQQALFDAFVAAIALMPIPPIGVLVLPNTPGTGYLPPGWSAAITDGIERFLEVPPGVSFQLDQMVVRHRGGSVGDTTTFTVRKNGADTALLVAIAAGAGAGSSSDTSHSVSFTTGDRFSLKGVNGPSITAGLDSPIVTFRQRPIPV